jgi:dihydroorotase
MADLREAGAIGVSDDGKCVMNAAVMRSALEYARTFDMLFSQHCEDHNLTAGAQMHEGHVSTRLGLGGWPRAAEDIIVARDLILAELTGARYHVAHVSSLGAVRLLREAKSRGLAVSAEVTPHHLLLDHVAAGLRHRLQGESAPARAGGHRGAAPGTQRRHDRLHCDRSRPALFAGEGL